MDVSHELTVNHLRRGTPQGGLGEAWRVGGQPVHADRLAIGHMTCMTIQGDTKKEEWPYANMSNKSRKQTTHRRAQPR